MSKTRKMVKTELVEQLSEYSLKFAYIPSFLIKKEEKQSPKGDKGHVRQTSVRSK